MLILHIISSPSELALASRSFEVNADQAVLGRDASCQIVLPDPERVVSGRHVRFERVNGTWSLTDTSTNGTYHNQPSNILSNGQRVALSDGDLLGIGDFEVKVEIVPEIRKTQSMANNVDASDQRLEPMLVPSLNQEMDQKAPVQDEGVPALFRDFLSERGDEDSGPSPDIDAPMPEPNSNPIQPKKTDESPLPMNADVPPVGFNPFVESDSSVPPQQPDQRRYDIPAQHQPFTPPAVAPAAHDSVDHDPDPFEQSSSWDAFGDDPFERKDPTPSSVAVNGSSNTADLAMAAFNQGLGTVVDPGDANTAKLFLTAGQLIREYTQGLMELNSARNEIKREFGLATTEMQALGNNPVKFSANLEDALAKLFTEQGGAYLEPAESVRDAHRDILIHQMALLSAMRHSLHDLVERFNPVTLQSTELDESSVFDKVGFVKDDSRNWKRFLEVYEEVVADSENDFLRVVGESIHAAYRDQIRELSQSESNQVDTAQSSVEAGSDWDSFSTPKPK